MLQASILKSFRAPPYLHTQLALLQRGYAIPSYSESEEADFEAARRWKETFDPKSLSFCVTTLTSESSGPEEEQIIIPSTKLATTKHVRGSGSGGQKVNK